RFSRDWSSDVCSSDLRRGGAPARPRRGLVLAHLHRRRRVAGVPRGQDAARYRRSGAFVSRKPLIAGNWKMNLNHLEAIALVQKIAFTLPEKYYAKVDVAVLPPFTDIRSVQTLIDGDKLLLTHGAQDLSPYDKGAYTGDVSGPMLAKLGCRYVTVGHSERREYHAESDELVNKKVRAALKHEISPILCVGEKLEVREEGRHIEHTTAQVIAGLKGLKAEQVADVVIAYEPVWAI